MDFTCILASINQCVLLDFLTRYSWISTVF